MDIKPYSRKVYYYETDKMGIVHHANYIRWFEEARVYYIEEAGLPFETVESQGVLSPVLSAECEYKLPFHFNDTFLITAAITEFGGARFAVSYIVTDPEGIIHATGKTTHCFVDTEMRPIRLKKNYPRIYDVYNKLYLTGSSDDK
ncbi:MAG: acyl-CoA thioesterase [Huintestinicola sp.]